MKKSVGQTDKCWGDWVEEGKGSLKMTLVFGLSQLKWVTALFKDKDPALRKTQFGGSERAMEDGGYGFRGVEFEVSN